MQSFRSSVLPGNVTGEPYPGNPNYSIQSTNYAFADINGDGIPDLLEATFLYESQRVPGYPLPQRVHFLDEGGGVVDTLVVLEDGEMHNNGDGGDGGAGGGEEHDDAGRSVTAGQLFSDSPLPDVVFASAEGIVTSVPSNKIFFHGNVTSNGIHPQDLGWNGMEWNGMEWNGKPYTKSLTLRK